MYLSPEELRDYEAHAKRIGAMPQNAVLERVHISLAPGATREGGIAEAKRVSERVATGDFDLLKDFDARSIDYAGTYRTLRRMGWGRLRAGWHVAKKWLRRPAPEPANGG